MVNISFEVRPVSACGFSVLLGISFQVFIAWFKTVQDKKCLKYKKWKLYIDRPPKYAQFKTVFLPTRTSLRLGESKLWSLSLHEETEKKVDSFSESVKFFLISYLLQHVNKFFWLFDTALILGQLSFRGCACLYFPINLFLRIACTRLSGSKENRTCKIDTGFGLNISPS